MKVAAAAIAQMTGEDIALLEKSGAYAMAINDEEFAVTLEDVIIATEDIPGWTVATDGEITVALDVTV